MLYIPQALVSLLTLSSLACPSPLPEQNPSLQGHGIPTVKEAAYSARLLLLSESFATLSTIYPSPIDPTKPGQPPAGVAGYPVGLIDYYADCSSPLLSPSAKPPATRTPGNPTLLSIRIATTFKNVAAGSPISLSIYQQRPGSSVASQPRLSLLGKLKSPTQKEWTKKEEGNNEGNEEEEESRVDEDTSEELLKCFTKRHRDAKWWVPGSKIHDSEWVEMDVEGVYWVGGFGDRAYIGWIPVDMWRGVVLKDEDVWTAWEVARKRDNGLEEEVIVGWAPEVVQQDLERGEGIGGEEGVGPGRLVGKEL